jgi:thymidylate synthase
MTTLAVLNPARAAEQAIRLCLHEGKLVAPRGQECAEVTNATFVIEEPWQVPFTLDGRGLRPFIGAVEALQLVGQTSSPEVVVGGAPPMGAYRDGGVFHGAYGIRIHGRLQPLVDLLRKDPDTRQAVLSIYDARLDLGQAVNDIPCTLTLQYMIRDGALCARTSMRSNDVWLGLPYDLVQFISLQDAIACALGIPMGWYSHTVGSLHLYRHNVELAETVAAKESFRRPYMPLWGESSIDLISTTARRILHGRFVSAAMTDYELWAMQAMLAARS